MADPKYTDQKHVTYGDDGSGFSVPGDVSFGTCDITSEQRDKSEKFHIRLNVANTGAKDTGVVNWYLYFNTSPSTSGWTQVTTSSGNAVQIVASDSAALAAGDALTTNKCGATGTWQNGEYVEDPSTYTVSAYKIPNTYYTEFQFCIQFTAAATYNQTYYFMLAEGSATSLDNYSVYGQVECVEVAADRDIYIQTETVGVDEDVTVELPDALTVDVFDAVGVTEDRTVELFDETLFVSVYEDVGLEDEPTVVLFEDTLSVTVYENVVVSEYAALFPLKEIPVWSWGTVGVATSVGSSISAGDDTWSYGQAIVKHVFLEPPGATTIDVFDSVGVAESVDVSLPDALEVFAYDSVSAQEDVVAELPDSLQIDVYDSAGLDESVSVLLPDTLEVFVADTPNVQDIPVVQLPDSLEIDVFDGIGVAEDKTVAIGAQPPISIDVFDTVGVDESLEIRPPSSVEATGVKVRWTTVDTRTSTGTQDITISGFDEDVKGVLLLAGQATSDGSADDHLGFMVGVADSELRQAYVAQYSVDNVGTVNAGRRGQNDMCVGMWSSGATNLHEAELESIIPDGIRLNWITMDAAVSFRLTVVLIGGEGFTAFAGAHDTPNTQDTSNSSANMGMEPDALITGFLTQFGTSNAQNMGGMGFAINDGSETQRCVAFNNYNGYDKGRPSVRVEEDRIAAYILGSSLNYTVELSAFTSTGFTVYSRDGTGLNRDFCYLAMKVDGGDFFLDTIDSPTDTGSDSVSGVGFMPGFIMELMTMAQSTETNIVGSADAGAFGLYLADQTEAERSLCISDEDAADPTNTKSRTNTAIELMNDEGTLAFEGSFGGFSSDGWTRSFTTADGTARKWIAFGMKTPLGAPANAVDVFDGISVGEDVTVSIAEAPPLSIDVFDAVGITESVEAVFELVPSVFDSVGVADVPSVELPDSLSINVFDSVGLDEDITVQVSVVGELYIDVFDSVGIAEDITVELEVLRIDVFDSVTIEEDVTVSVSVVAELYVDVFDSVTIAEDVTVELEDLAVFTFDAVTVTESSTSFLADLEVSSFDSVTVTEETAGVTSGLLIDVFDSVGIDDQPTVLVAVVGELYISVFDVISITEATEGIASAVILTTYDSVSVTEAVEVAPELVLSVYDDISVQEAVLTSPSDLPIEVFDSILVSEDVTVVVAVPSFLEISVWDSISITESVYGVASGLFISVHDDVAVSERAVVQILVAAGKVRVYMTARIPDIEFSSKTPELIFMERSPDMDFRSH